jgi:large subunit ribosomal protein L13
MADIVLDAENAIVGRLCTHAAKQAMLGRSVAIVNSEKAIISGNATQIIAKYKQQRDRGTPFRGPFLSRLPDRFLRRILRGMLPYKQGRGKEAYKNVMCYLGVPEEFDGKVQKLERADLFQSNIVKFVTIQQICRELGGKI